MLKNKTVNINLNFGDVIKIILFLVFLFLLYEFRALVLIILTAVILASAVEPIIRRLQKIKIPRVVAVTIVYIFIIFLLLLVSLIFIPPLIEQLNNLIADIPGYIDGLKSWLGGQINKGGIFSQLFVNLNTELNELSLIDTTAGLNQNVNTVKDILISLFGGLFNFLLIFVLSFYFAMREHGVANFLKIVTPVKYTKYILNLWKRTEVKIARWMQGQFLLGFIIALMTYFGLKIFFGFEQALLLALLAGVTELIPIIGPILAAIPAIIIGFSIGGYPMLIGVIIFYAAIQLVENNVIYPLVVKKVVGVPSFLVIISLLIGAQLFGFLGIILSIPIAAAVMEYVKDVERRQLEAIKKGEEQEHPTLF